MQIAVDGVLSRGSLHFNHRNAQQIVEIIPSTNASRAAAG